MRRLFFYLGILAGALIIMSEAFSEEVQAGIPKTAGTQKTEDTQKTQSLLTDPILMAPGDTSVHVVWFTENEGIDNIVILFEDGTRNPSTRIIKANTTLMSRLRGGKTSDDCNNPQIRTPIYRHEALVNSLPEYNGRFNEKIYYRVKSDDAISDFYTLQAKAQPGTPLKILLTSDLQNKPMCASNLTKVYETVGQVDAIFANGDIVDVIDRAYDWFYADNAFFKVLQGRAEERNNADDKEDQADKDDKGSLIAYKGAPILQNAPIYASVGNHDYMGRYNETDALDVQFNNPAPDDFNRITWEEIFTMPDSISDSENYYLTSIGDLGLVTLDVNRPWRLSELGIRGRYSELIDSTKDILGHGEFIFEPVGPGSRQYDFYEKSFAYPEFKKSKYKVVMFHSPYSTLGRNGVHAFCNPVKNQVKDPVTGKNMDIFSYPKSEDLIAEYLVPLMEKNHVNLLFEGHTHIWNRFKTGSGLNVLETSNVGNSYGGFDKTDEIQRPDIPSAFIDGSDRSELQKYWDINDFALSGDLYGNEPVYPSIKDLPGKKPYLASETITAFSILDTAAGCVDSYYFDTEKPDSPVVKFDSFKL